MQFLHCWPTKLLIRLKDYIFSMSVRETTVLSRTDLKYLLIDSLNLYSNNVVFIDGNNPYRFSINKKNFYILIKNIHESGENRPNQDECRIQISRTKNFNPAINSKENVIILGYFHDERVFAAWNPFLFSERFNEKKNVSLFSRFSIQTSASKNGIDNYTDQDSQSVISFKPEYLGLYLENFESMHLLKKNDLQDLITKSDETNIGNSFDQHTYAGNTITVTHQRYTRDPAFKKGVYEAYDFKCAICGIQLELIEAAHIVPHSHKKGTDEISNGICLCALHHTAYDKSLIFFDDKFNVKVNDEKMEYLKKIGQDSGIYDFQKLSFEKIKLPNNPIFRPKIENINLANQIRGIV